MDGPTATRAIRLMGYTGRIFGVTGNAMAADVQLFTESGVDQVLVKPFSLPDFHAALVPGSFASGPPDCDLDTVESGADPDPQPRRDDSDDRADRRISRTHTHRPAVLSTSRPGAYVRTVLVVEDNTLNRKMLVKLFNSVDQVVEEARNGQDAVDKVTRRMALKLPPYDAILMDFTMVSARAL